MISRKAITAYGRHLQRRHGDGAASSDSHRLKDQRFCRAP
jgi:hypothetical protein